MEKEQLFKSLYVVEDPSGTKFFRGRLKGDIDEVLAISRGEKSISHLEIDYVQGGAEPDSLFWNRILEPICIKQSVAEAMQAAGLTGWNSIPVTVRNRNGEVITEPYVAMTVTGRSAGVDYLHSAIGFHQYPGGMVPYFKGLYFDPDSWDGTDIFMEHSGADGKTTGFIYVSEKLVRFFRKNKIRNIRFVPFQEYELDCSILSAGASPELKLRIDAKIKEAIYKQ